MQKFLASYCTPVLFQCGKYSNKCIILYGTLQILITVVWFMLPADVDVELILNILEPLHLDGFKPRSRIDINLNELWWNYYAKEIFEGRSYIEIMNELNDMECKNILSKYNFWTQTINPIMKKSNALVIDVSMYYNEIDIFEARFYELYHSVDLFVVNEFTITCSTLKQEKIQFIDNLKEYKPYLYYNHYLPQNAKPKIVHFLIDAFNERFENQTGRDALRSFILNFLDVSSKNRKHRLLNLKFNQTIYNITNGKRSVNNSLINDDIFIFSDLDEIPRGIMIYFFFKSKCSKYINNIYNLPITLDFLQYAYDFGCKMTSNTKCDIDDINTVDKSQLDRNFQKLNLNSNLNSHLSCKKHEWRHGGIIRYGQLNINISKCLVVDNHFVNFEKPKLEFGVRYHDYDDEHNICYYDLRQLGRARKFEKHYRRKHWNETNFRYPITIIHGGWHLTSFYKNYTHKMNLKLENSQDPAKHSTFTKNHIQCYKIQCVELLRKIYSKDMYVHKYFKLSQLKAAMEYKYDYSEYNEYNDSNNYKYNKNMFAIYTVHNKSSYNKTSIMMNNKPVYYNFTSLQDILRAMVDYPQWVLKQAIYEKHHFWIHMFPLQPAKISKQQKQLCRKTPLLHTKKETASTYE